MKDKVKLFFRRCLFSILFVLGVIAYFICDIQWAMSISMILFIVNSFNDVSSLLPYTAKNGKNGKLECGILIVVLLISGIWVKNLIRYIDFGDSFLFGCTFVSTICIFIESFGAKISKFCNFKVTKKR